MDPTVPILEVKDLSHVYSAGTPFEHVAIERINLSFRSGELVGVIGHTGSGKSTLIQHLNGLLKPTSGKVLFKGEDIWKDKKFTHAIRAGAWGPPGRCSGWRWRRPGPR